MEFQRSKYREELGRKRESENSDNMDFVLMFTVVLILKEKL
jgi:hypothetical protein